MAKVANTATTARSRLRRRVERAFTFVPYSQPALSAAVASPLTGCLGKAGMLRPERALGASVAAPFRTLACASRLISGNKLMLATADQVSAAHPAKCLAQLR